VQHFYISVLHSMYRPRNENKMAPQWRNRVTKFGPRCVVVLLMVGLPPDWFWCDQPPFILFTRDASSVRLLGHSTHVSLRSCPCLGCGGMSTRALSFVAAPLYYATRLGRASGSHSFSHGGIPTIHLASPYRGSSFLRPGSPYAPGSMPGALQRQWRSFSFAGVNVHRFNIPRVGVQPHKI